MANYDVKIDLKKVKGAFLSDIKGSTTMKKCICIPTELLYESEKTGSVYLDLKMIEPLKKSLFGDTHYVKQSYTKSVYLTLSDEEKSKSAILGNAKEGKGWGNKPNDENFLKS